ncbi:MAG: type II toxin-antitoxin system PemK/MazF family toxin [Candidatus Omnitrophota bacterium]|nr:type II toxin-antitoxin system PemK/MazF family toxin [Candidatus Omnitrophota bacterium]
MIFGSQETSLSSRLTIPLRGQIWKVNLDPAIGDEMNKVRPVVVLNSDAINTGLSVKIVAPITGWQQHFANNIFHIKVIPDANNKLTKDSATNVLQVRALDTKRFVSFEGIVSAIILEEAVTALAALLEYQ